MFKLHQTTAVYAFYFIMLYKVHYLHKYSISIQIICMDAFRFPGIITDMNIWYPSFEIFVLTSVNLTGTIDLKSLHADFFKKQQTFPEAFI